MLLYLSLRGISWSGIWLLVSRAARGPLALSLVIASVSLFVRAIRWQLLLRTKANIGVVTTFAAISTGYCGNLFLPARAGELIRMLMIHRASGLSKAFVLTTEVCERVSDAVALVLISSLTLLAMPVRPGWFARASAPFIAVALIGLLGIAFLPKLELLLGPWLDRLPVSAHLRSKAHAIAGQISGGLRNLHRPKLLIPFLALTGLAWFADACTAVLIMRAMGLPGTLAIAFLLNTGLGLGSALPATPGYIGVYQFVAISVLGPFGFSKTGAVGYILFFQVMQYILISFWAALGVLVWRARFAPAPESLPVLKRESA